MRADFSLCTVPREESQNGSETLGQMLALGTGVSHSASAGSSITEQDPPGLEVDSCVILERRPAVTVTPTGKWPVSKDNLRDYFCLLPIGFFPTRDTKNGATEKGHITLSPGVWPWGSQRRPLWAAPGPDPLWCSGPASGCRGLLTHHKRQTHHIHGSAQPGTQCSA